MKRLMLLFITSSLIMNCFINESDSNNKAIQEEAKISDSNLENYLPNVKDEMREGYWRGMKIKYTK